MKFTDAVRNTLQGYFNAGDQPTEAQFTALILAIQEGIEEHDHDGTGDGDGLADLGPLSSLTMADGAWIGIGAALERIVFDDAGDICVMGADFGVGTLTPITLVELEEEFATTDTIETLLTLTRTTSGGAANDIGVGIDFQVEDAAAGTPLAASIGVLWISAAGDRHGALVFGTRDGAVNDWGDAGFEKMRIDYEGKISIGLQAALGKVHIDQSNNAAAIPVLVLDQADVSEGTINFIASERGVIGEGTNSVQSVRVELNGTVYRLAVYANA